MSRARIKSRVHDECVGEFLTEMGRRNIFCVPFEGARNFRGVKQPDLLVPRYNLLVEIKTLQPEPVDEKALVDINNQIELSGIASYYHPDYYSRFLRLLAAARKQFRPYANFKTLVVIYDRFDFFLKQDPQILMEGLQKIIIKVPHNPQENSYVTRIEYEHKPFRESLNNEIGAIAFPKRQESGFIVYFNQFTLTARSPQNTIFNQDDVMTNWPDRIR